MLIRLSYYMIIPGKRFRGQARAGEGAIRSLQPNRLIGIRDPVHQVDGVL